MSCLESERQALLAFKRGLVDEDNRLGSWVGGSCCDWDGVSCNNPTGHVIGLHLQAHPYDLDLYLSQEAYSRTRLRGTISPSLLHLKQLVRLNLSWNDFGGAQIPPFLGLMTSLEQLDLSYAGFGGKIPESLRNLSGLRSLDLSNNNLNSTIPNWLYSFSSRLEFLSLGANNLQGVISSAIRNLTSLTVLSLGGSYDDGLEIGGRETIKSMGQLCNLRHLELWGVKVNEDVVDVFHDLFSSSCPSNGLEELRLDSDGISGDLTKVPFDKYKSLVFLSLSDNSIYGSIPPSFGELQSLESFSIEENLLMVGSVTETHFAKLTRLKTFWASGNKMELKVSPSWIPPFQLGVLELSSWKLGKEFPRWLHSQKSIEDLDLSGCGIEGAIPEWFRTTSSQLEGLDLSNNRLRGEVPNLDFYSNLYYLDLSNNLFESISKEFWNFHGSLYNLNLSYNRIVGEMWGGNPIAFWEGGVVDLRSNKFHGRLPPFSSKLTALDLSDNFITGSLSHFLCYQMNETKQMQVLNLANNFLSGEIPDCWMPWNSLTTLRLNNNNFSGRVPSSMENLRLLESLHLRSNNLVGGLPLLLRSCQDLFVVDLSENQLQGKIPSWIGKSNLTILSLRSNRFHGKLPEEICALATLQIIDLANNNLSGSIPRCINQLSAMITNDSMGSQISKPLQVGGDLEDAIIVMKGRAMEYNTTLNLVRIMDFSHNFFTGKIPDEVTALGALQSLNLSQNILSGQIPQNIGAMRLLESLDLSLNKLVGEIPSSISGLTFLSHLNLSSNNLTGRIPSSTQLQSFNASCFSGNDLCGSPLANSCDEHDATPPATDAHGATPTTFVDVEWFFVGMAFGFVFGFWVFLFPVLYNRRWRLVYSSFLDGIVIFICESIN